MDYKQRTRWSDLAAALMAKNPNAVALGRKGGEARASNLTKAEKIASAKKAAQTRWKGHTATSRKGKKKGKA